jgi:hypothetical protein
LLYTSRARTELKTDRLDALKYVQDMGLTRQTSSRGLDN